MDFLIPIHTLLIISFSDLKKDYPAHFLGGPKITWNNFSKIPCLIK